LRRSSAGRALFALAVMLAAPPSPASAQKLECVLSTAAGVTAARLSYACARPAELVASLRSGLESRVTFTVRLWERRGLLGDRRLAERSVSRGAYWDFLDERFVVEAEDGTRSYYDTPEALLDGFLSLEMAPLAAGLRPGARPAYVTARAVLEPVRLMPPLTVVVWAGAAAAESTPWIRREAP
jgi:hypothetical protein